jgi:GntR family transcriptional repressor for pyruvate dehydrogenase complex
MKGSSSQPARSGDDPEPLGFAELPRGPRLSDRVVESMRSEILSRRLTPGTQLPSERELVEQFGVSRTVIREAVGALAGMGLVEVRSGSGIQVAAADESTATKSLSWYIRGGGLEYPKVHEIRSMVEVEMSVLAAQRRTDDHMTILVAAHEHFGRELTVGVDVAAIADVEFHEAIARATGNELFSVLLGSIADALVEIRRELLRGESAQETLERAQETLAQHGAILAAIGDRDADGARLAMRTHLVSVERHWAEQQSRFVAADKRAGS